MLELIYNCTWQRTTLNGVNGCWVTGPNGNSIFVPAAGYRDGTELRRRGGGGGYWSASSWFGHCYCACVLVFRVDGSYWDPYWGPAWGGNYRSEGRSVRPVCDK